MARSGGPGLPDGPITAGQCPAMTAFPAGCAAEQGKQGRNLINEERRCIIPGGAKRALIRVAIHLLQNDAHEEALKEGESV